MKTITLNANGIGRYDDVSPFIIANGAIELNVDCPNVNGEFYIIAENNGKKYKSQIVRGNSVKLAELTAGELKAEVQHYLKGVLIKRYKIEPLILRELDTELSATPEIAYLNEKCASLERSLAELKNAAETGFKALSGAVAKEKKKTLALIKFAWEDYKNNVYLEGGDFEKFVSNYGLVLSGEEIKIIKGEDKNED